MFQHSNGIVYSDTLKNGYPKCLENMFQDDYMLQQQLKTIFQFYRSNEKSHYCAAARFRTLYSTRGKDPPYYDKKTASRWRSLWEVTNFLCTPNLRIEKGSFVLLNGAWFLSQAAMGPVLSQKKTKTNQVIYLSFGNDAPDTIYASLLKHTGTKVV